MNTAGVLSVCLSTCLVLTLGKGHNMNKKYSNIWVAKVRGGEEVAKRVAKDLGYTYKGQAGQFKDYYELVREDHPEVSFRDSEHLTHSLLDLDEVVWAKQQKLVRPTINVGGLWQYTEDARREEVMDFLRAEASKIKLTNRSCASLFSCITNIPSRIYVTLKSNKQGDIRKLGTFSTKPAPKEQLWMANGYSQITTKNLGLLSKKISAYTFTYNDPFWVKQWNMQDYRTSDMPVMDLNVVQAHKIGYTGKKVTVAVVDGGLDPGHPEYKDNFLHNPSYNYCEESPSNSFLSHGTNCAGVIAMKPNNKLCGVGIAFDAKIVGITAICRKYMPESTTAKALIHNLDDIDIYSNSWATYTLGKYIGDLNHMTREALIQGTTKGRDGNGVIYVKGSGNDRDNGDNCAVDGDLNNVFVITISGADQWGKPAYYSERCAAVFATTYTESGWFTEGIVTTEIKGGCSSDFSGTSAACPQASAIIALALEANPDLTYRDVMHLITYSSEVAPLADNVNTWYKNGRDLWVSNDFGFGLMNAENMVTLAKTWERVPKKSVCVETVRIIPPKFLSYGSDVKVSFVTEACEGTEDEVNFLEHIELTPFVRYPVRGHIMIYLNSPSGTTTLLLESRPKDYSNEGLQKYSIMSNQNWGETPRGEWSVLFKINNLSPTSYSRRGLPVEFTINFHGTKDMPAHYNKQRKYAAFRLPDGTTSHKISKI